MNIKDVKSSMNNTVYYDTGQFNFDGCSIKDFILTGCILRKKKQGVFYYQAELKDPNANARLIVPLEKVLRKGDV